TRARPFHAPRSRIAAGRPPCIPHALAWSPGLLSGVPLGNTRCEASAFSPVTLLMRHIADLTTPPRGTSVAVTSPARRRLMGEILGLGITHYPGLCYKGNITRRIKMLLADPLLPEHLRSPAGWHATMREQWGTDQGAAHSEKHRSDMIHHFRRARA